MNIKTKKMVVIITEFAIKDQVIKVIEDLGAKGYTLEPHLSGRGTRGVRDDNVMFGENVKVSVITNVDIADEISTAVANKFLKHYAGIIYMHDVEMVIH